MKMSSYKINKIKRSDYEKLKSAYLEKNRSRHSLYVDFNKKQLINKRIFSQLLNKIRIEEGYPEFVPLKKTKRKNNKYSYLDKHPDSYKSGRKYLN